ncbi:MAG: pilus assembly protein PilZ [Geobacteraceae bacterium GWC2_58_44]|nr:MAG: pilus assembly protein PilZ [Geobacteraceae bacterium GWC2_58_44]HBG06867.1 PilZ domain-containing protein [Geobacter sp.]
MESARKILEFVSPGTEIEFTKGSEKEIGLTKLINRLNFMNFQDDSILVNFTHLKYSRTVSLPAAPLPCLNNKLECHWIQTSDYKPSLKACSFENILIDDGRKLVLAVPELITLGERGAIFLLPEKCVEVNYRKTRRHICQGIRVELLQNGARLQGTLVDFSAVSFKMETESSPTQTFHWVNPDVPVQVVLSSGSGTIYSGQCRITSQNLGQRSRSYVLAPMQSHMQRFKAKEIRSVRHELLPLPNAVFQHPLTGKSIDLKVIDVSGSGFSVQEEVELSVLLPGMIITDLELKIANGFATKCMAQVIYRVVKTEDDGSCAVKCGLSFLDMDIREHVNLLSLLYLAKNKHSYMNSKVNTEELWQFFFETGFIYPAKYAFVQANKSTLKEMYEKLYTQNPGVARHFIYHEKGAILGHMAMLRFYKKSWLVHHHAANKSESVNGGLVVLNQLAQSINDSYNLNSAQMHYVICYYRPENRFPHRVFGGAARIINDKKGCSTDTFAYLHYRRNASDNWNFSGPWELERSTAEDLLELESFYEHESGGLMLHALNLEPDTVDCDELWQEYRQLGFTLKRHCYTLKKQGNIKAVVTVNLSDVGLNLSDLTNCIHVIVIDQEQLPKEIINLMLSILTHRYEQNDLPVLVYPASYADAAHLPYEKQYALWILNVQHNAPHFLKFLAGLVTRNRKKIDKEPA